MAISRAQLAKELEPGLNALFGMEYDRYDAEHAEIYDTESSDRAFEEEVMLSGFGNAPTKAEGAGVFPGNGHLRVKRHLLRKTKLNEGSAYQDLTSSQRDSGLDTFALSLRPLAWLARALPSSVPPFSSPRRSPLTLANPAHTIPCSCKMRHASCKIARLLLGNKQWAPMGSNGAPMEGNGGK